MRLSHYQIACLQGIASSLHGELAKFRIRPRTRRALLEMELIETSGAWVRLTMHGRVVLQAVKLAREDRSRVAC